MEEKKVDYLYCSDTCPIGKAKKEQFLEENNSAYDAAFDMIHFVQECTKTCKRCEISDS